MRQLEQYGVRDGLAGQRRARGAEGDRRAVFSREFEQRLDLALRFDLEDHLRDQAVEGRVRAVGEGAHGVREHVLGFHGAAQRRFFPERGVAAVLQSFAVDVPKFGRNGLGLAIDAASHILY